LKFYLSKPFTLKIHEQKETAEVEFINGMVILNQPGPANEKRIEFPDDSEGKLIDIPGPGKGRELHLLFQGRTLIFKRNVHQNCYDLSSVKVIDYKFYETVSSGEAPRLYVYGQDRRNPYTEVLVLPVTKASHDMPRPKEDTDTVQPDKNKNRGGYDDYFRPSDDTPYLRADRPLISGDMPVMAKSGQGNYLTQTAVAEYLYGFRGNIPRKDIDVIIGHYINEAKILGVNHDIAIAQMCHATDFLRNDLWKVMNYANFSKEGAVLNGKSWNGAFPDSRTGVRAHIQHLRGYASARSFAGEIVDPRFRLLGARQGKGDTLHKLCGMWPWKDPAKYEASIKAKLEVLYDYQDSYYRRVLAARL
jgi:hypothetical protein